MVLRQQTALARFGELALTSDDLDEILTEACRLAGDALGTDLAKVVELQADGKTLVVRAGVGWKPGVIGVATLTASEDTSEGHALRTGEPMISPDIAKETRFNYPAFLIDNGVKAVANVLIIGGHGKPPFGILQIDSRTPRRFTASDVAFLRSYANLLAATVDRLHVLRDVREGEARLNLALETGKLGSWQLDLADGSATRNRRHDHIFGHADLLPAWNFDIFLDHVVPEDREPATRAFHHAVDSGGNWHFECRIRRADDGAIRWIEIHGRPDGARGNRPAHMLGIVADITERKRTEAALRQSNEMLEARVAERTSALTAANAQLLAEAAQRAQIEDALRQSQKMEAVGQLTGGLAHDFNNLLAGISGSLELMQARVAEGRLSEIERYIGTAAASAARAAALTQRLLVFARRQLLAPKPTDINRLIIGLETLFHGTLGPSIHVETRLSEGLWPVLCDPNQLENALLNLVINARDAMPDGGRLLIETTNTVFCGEATGGDAAPGDATPGHATPGDATPGDGVALVVTDTGTGMAPAVVARAFDPFYTTKPLGVGTGLGLSMTHGFVKQSGGHVHLRSALGHGTAVTIHLPRHLGATDGVETDTAIAPPRAPASTVVLVVEDEPIVRMVMREQLVDCGFTVLEAHSGPSGLRAVESNPGIDLLLTDVGLPGGMNGRQLADLARQRRPGLKVLFITGYAESALVGAGTLDPGMAVMIKPFLADALVARVQGMIG